MGVGTKSSKSTIRLYSLYLEKILKTQQNLSKPSPQTIWRTNNNNVKHEEEEEEEEVEVRTLTLNHPILRILESSRPSLSEFNQIHSQLIVSGLFQHSLASSQVVKKLCSSPSLTPHAVFLFSHFEEPDAFLCNTIMRSYVNANDPESAIGFYYRGMVRNGILPNHYTFPLLAKISAELGLVRQGENTHCLVVKCGLETNVFVANSMIYMYSCFRRIREARKVFDEMRLLDMVSWNSMIDGYVKNGEVGTARELFDEMPERDMVSWNTMIAGHVSSEDMVSAKELFDLMLVKDVVTWNSMIDGYARIGNEVVARELFEMMPSRNVVSWNTILALYVRCNHYHECLKLFDKMMQQEGKPNEATLVSVLTACATLDELDRGKWVHAYLKENLWIEPDVLLSTALLTMYAKCGVMDLAREVFDDMPGRNVVSWNSMIMGYGMQGNGEKALKMLLEMEKSSEIPNGATFICVFSACAHSGMVLEGWWCFEMMQRVYKIEPKVEHYGCMVDLLSRAGLMKDSEEIMLKMPMNAGPALWGALLSSCTTHSNFQLGEIIGKRLIELDPKDVGPYVLLSNIYAMEGKWDDVENVRKMMREKGLQKAAGSSLVNLSNSSGISDSFENRCASSHKENMVYSMLSEMAAQIKLSWRDGVS